MKHLHLHAWIILSLFLSSIISSCSVNMDSPPEESAAAEATPAVPDYEEEQELSDEDTPQPDPALWHDPVTDDYWLIGGKGTTDYLMVLCIGEYRMASYSEILKAAIDGLSHDYPRINDIWTAEPAYHDPATGKTYNFYADLADSKMKTAEYTSIKSLACIWDPEQ